MKLLPVKIVFIDHTSKISENKRKIEGKKFEHYLGRIVLILANQNSFQIWVWVVHILFARCFHHKSLVLCTCNTVYSRGV